MKTNYHPHFHPHTGVNIFILWVCEVEDGGSRNQSLSSGSLFLSCLHSSVHHRMPVGGSHVHPLSWEYCFWVLSSSKFSLLLFCFLPLFFWTSWYFNSTFIWDFCILPRLFMRLEFYHYHYPTYPQFP